MTRRAQLNEVLTAVQLDPSVLASIGSHLDSVLESRNILIRDLEQAVGALTKAHNDTVRVFDAKLRAMGLPAEETVRALLPSVTGTGPAGLVAKPSFL